MEGEYRTLPFWMRLNYMRWPWISFLRTKAKQPKLLSSVWRLTANPHPRPPLPHPPIRRLRRPRVRRWPAPRGDHLRKPLANLPEPLRRRSQRDVHILIVVAGDPLRHPDRRQDGAADAGRLAVAQFRHHRDAHVEGFPGRDAAAMRKRIEADVDEAIGGEMFFARGRSHQAHAIRR